MMPMALRIVLLLLVTLPLPAMARVHLLHAGGERLTALIARAADGDTIVVDGPVREGPISIDRPLCLLGLPGAVIDGGGEGEVLVITADDVTLQGLTFTGTRISGLYDNAAIKVNGGARPVIRANRFIRCFFAIYLSGVDGALVEGNVIEGAADDKDRMGNGIHLWKCSKATIRRNLVRDHRDGIYFEFVTDSRIEDNLTHGNVRYGLHFMFSHRDRYERNVFMNNGAGVAVMFSHHIGMRRNRFLHNRGGSAYGLLLKEINDGEIADNMFMDNTTGLMVDGCNRITAEGNTFRSNGWALRLFANATACIFSGNTFQGNTFDVSTNGDLMLNTIGANYWDRHLGYDLDRDGHGDVPYRPVGFFALLVERVPYAIVFSRSLFVTLLDRAERVLPSLSPAALKDDRPLMRPPHG